MQPLGWNPGSCIGINCSSNRGYIPGAHLAWGLEHHCASDCWHLDRELTGEKMDWSDWISRVITKWLCWVKGDLGKKALLIIFRFLSLRLSLVLWWREKRRWWRQHWTYIQRNCAAFQSVHRIGGGARKIKFSKCMMWSNCRPWFGALEMSKRRRSPICYFSGWVRSRIKTAWLLSIVEIRTDIIRARSFTKSHISSSAFWMSGHAGQPVSAMFITESQLFLLKRF